MKKYLRAMAVVGGSAILLSGVLTKDMSDDFVFGPETEVTVKRIDVHDDYVERRRETGCYGVGMWGGGGGCFSEEYAIVPFTIQAKAGGKTIERRYSAIFPAYLAQSHRPAEVIRNVLGDEAGKTYTVRMKQHLPSEVPETICANHQGQHEINCQRIFYR